MLQPSVDVYILPLSYVQYHVERRKHGLTEVVPLPSDQYYLQLTNETVAELDPETSRVTGLVPGYTEVILHNKSILDFDFFQGNGDSFDALRVMGRWSF